jgi:ribokinase
VSFVLNSIEDDRTILTFKGANNFLYKSDLPEVAAPWVYISSMIEESWHSVVDFVCANSFNAAFNPSNYQAKLGYAKLQPLIDRVAILVMNKEEACNFLGQDYREDADMPALVRELAKVPGQIAAVTDGPNGVWVFDGIVVHAARPTEGLRILETTGAGDAFSSTFTACVIRNIAIREALDYGMTNAEAVLQHKGAKEKLLSWQELTARVKAGARAIQTC